MRSLFRFRSSLLGLLCLLGGGALAEGSRHLYPASYPATASRASLDWQPASGLYVGRISRKNVLYTYAQAGEQILTGSSSVSGTTVSTLISIYAPGNFGTPGNEVLGTPVNTCTVASTVAGTPGYIPSRAAELAGPKSASGNGGADTWTPCVYTAPSTGVYAVTVQPRGAGSPTGSVATLDRAGQAVAAWEVTVRSDAASTADLLGRVFTYAFNGFTGGNNRPVTSSYYVVTRDGFRYRENFAGPTGLGVDPNGYAVYANSRGFVDTFDNSPLYRNLRGSNAQVDPPLGAPAVSAQAAEFPLFFVDPVQYAGEVNRVLTTLGIPVTPDTPTVADPAFVNAQGGPRLVRGGSGTFSFTSNKTGTYQIVVSADGTDFDPENTRNRVLRGNAVIGRNAVGWDGRNNNLQLFASGSVRYQVVLNAGEVHFPLVDAENNPGAGPIVTLLNPPPGVANPNTVFYDDRGYVTKGGTAVGTLNGTLCPGPVPAAPTDPANLLGVDSSAVPYRNWGSGGNSNTDCAATAGWGDGKALDLWTFVRGNTVSTLDVAEAADLSVQKTVDNPTPVVGSTVTFTVTVRNAGPDATTNVTVSDALPAGYTLISAAPSQGTYAPTTGAWTVTPSAPLASGDQATLTITATVNPAGPYTNTAQLLSSDQPDPDSTPGNGVTTEDDQASVTPAPITPVAVVSKVAGATTLRAGPFPYAQTYVVTVRNTGSVPVTYSLQDTPALDPDVTVGTVTVSENGAAPVPLPGPAPYTLAQGRVLGAGAADTFTLTVTLAVVQGATDNDVCTGQAGNGLFNTAFLTVGAMQTRAFDCVPTPRLPDLRLQKSGPAFYRADQELTYTLAATSDRAASGVVVRDALPVGTTFVSASDGGVLSGQDVVWTLGDVPAGTRTLTLVLRTLPGARAGELPATLTNTATVSADQPDREASNNAGAASSQLVLVQLTKTVRNVTSGTAASTAGGGLPGETLEYCITALNRGVSVNNFAVQDAVPGNTAARTSAYGPDRGLQLGGAETGVLTSGADGDQGELTSAGGPAGAGLLTYRIGTLAAGVTQQVCFQVVVR
ncbi:hypothetical protein GCM10017784_29300 [Deinococcus indicus]|uniref:DUF11 domain-containing protein n=1 Tax=Deinococcus indicus TaxID=223556 RepID=UPI00174DD782|nr:DUF11 domain-containing protein [Deinococcus indicus]GHG33671.1 hypothetical protein GCM10017784_29300 [Deinococcus indicus]